jgi:membrane protease YdiL (CAAX protease family)
LYREVKQQKILYLYVCGNLCVIVVFYPSDGYCDTLKAYSITFIEGNARETHLISAALFLILLAYMSFLLFTKSNKLKGHRGQKKVIRNRIFRVCTGLVVLSLIIILLGFTGVINEDFYNANQLTFWMETAAVESFGFAWLNKGEAIFIDETKHITKNAIE